MANPITRFLRGVLGLREQDNLIQWRLQQQEEQLQRHIQDVDTRLAQFTERLEALATPSFASADKSSQQIELLAARFETFIRLQLQSSQQVHETIAAIRRDLPSQPDGQQDLLASPKEKATPILDQIAAYDKNLPNE